MNVKCLQLALLGMLFSASCNKSGPSPQEQPPAAPLTFRTKISDPCSVRDFNSIQAPAVERVFSTNDAAFHEFEKDFANHREQALRNWLASTSTFSGVQASEIELNSLSQQGRQNYGVYLVSTPSWTKRFVLKIAKHSGEAEKTWRLQNSLVGHPECWNNKTGVEFFPRIVGIYEAAYFPFKDKNGEVLQEGRLFPILLGEVKGKTLATLHDQMPTKSWVPDRAIGRSIGVLHFWMANNPEAPLTEWKTFVHGDLHGENVLLNAQNHATLIDNSNAEFASGIAYDISQLEGFSRQLYSHGNPIRKYLEKVYEAEAQRQGKKMAFGYSARSGEIFDGDALIAALEHPQIRSEVAQSKAFQTLFRYFDEFRAFVLGYLEVLPDARRADASVYFSEYCRNTLDKLVDNYYFIGDKDARKPQLLKVMRQVLTPELIDCIDKSQIDDLK